MTPRVQHSRPPRLGNRSIAFVAAVVVCGLCSACTSVAPRVTTASSDPFLNAPAAPAPQAVAAASIAAPPTATATSDILQTAYEVPASRDDDQQESPVATAVRPGSMGDNSGRVRIQSRVIQPAQAVAPHVAARYVREQLAASRHAADWQGTPGTSTAGSPTPRIERTPREDRVALSEDDVEWLNAQSQLAARYDDEYLFDGGDRLLPVHYDDFNMLGLETEDTVVEYNDHQQRRVVKPSNRVAVYAPKFASIVTVNSPTEGLKVDAIVDQRQIQLGANMQSRQVADANIQREALRRIDTRKRGNSVSTGIVQDSVVHRHRLVTHDQSLLPFQDLAFVQRGQFDQSDEARIALGIQNAAVWTRDQFPAIAATTRGGHQVVAQFKGAEIVGLDERLKKPGQIRIVKLADKKSARPGDIITFTIRYDNLGDIPVTDVVISDNLTPRLEYVPDSATCDRNGELITVDNDEGSLILRFQIDDPLPGKEGGIITFQARVR